MKRRYAVTVIVEVTGDSELALGIGIRETLRRLSYDSTAAGWRRDRDYVYSTRILKKRRTAREIAGKAKR